jgi:dsDNA-specific endonuclease/ATPase MutS2
MAAPFSVGDSVQTPFGKGVVRDVRNQGQVLVDVRGRTLVVNACELSPIDTAAGRSRPRRTAPPSAVTSAAADRADTGGATDVDLHGLTVAEALARAELALNQAMLDDRGTLRLIHGRSGGRIRAALHARLGQIPTVRGFGIDPANAGVTVVRL